MRLLSSSVDGNTKNRLTLPFSRSTSGSQEYCEEELVTVDSGQRPPKTFLRCLLLTLDLLAVSIAQHPMSRSFTHSERGN